MGTFRPRGREIMTREDVYAGKWGMEYLDVWDPGVLVQLPSLEWEAG